MSKNLVVVLVLASLILSLICVIQPVAAFKSGSGGTHDFIFNQASVILRNDGFVSIADFLNSYDPGDTNGRTYLGVMEAGSTDHDDLISAREHYMDPMDHTGLYFAGYQKSAGTLCQEVFDTAVNYWRSGDHHNAIYYLGWAAHLVQDVCVPHHAQPTYGDWHTGFEDYVDSVKYEVAASSGGIYSLSSFPDREYYQTENAGPPGNAYWHYSGSDPTAYDWVDYNAHESTKFFYLVNGQTNSDPTDAAVVQAETIHSLPNNLDSNFTFVEYGMDVMQLYFDKFDMENGWDFIRIYDASDNLLASYTGVQNGFWTPHFYNTGGVLKVRVTTDSSVQSWGYKITQIHYHDRIESPPTAAIMMLIQAQRTTAGFIKYFFDLVQEPPSVGITPGSVAMDLGQSQLFTSTVSGGTSAYSYQWWLSTTTVLGNTIVNSGFDTGGIAAWNQESPYSPDIRSDEHHSGSYSCASPYSGSTYLPFKITQKLPSVLSDLVTSVSCWRKWGIPSKDWLRVNYTDGSVSSIGLGSSSDWTHVSLNLVANKTVDSLILERTASDGYIICVDDVEFSVNGRPVSGATGPTWAFTPSSLGSYKVYVQVTDNAGFITNSNFATVTVNPIPSVAISPTSVIMDVGQSQPFSSIVSGGTSPYSYQWYLCGNITGNTVTNSGFETGDLTGWSNYADVRSDEHHTGNYSCAPPYVWWQYWTFTITQKFSVPSNIVTNVSCWYKYGTSYDYLIVNYTDGSFSSIGLGYSADWTYVSLNLVANKTVDSLILSRSSISSNIIYIDDVEFDTLNSSPVSNASSWTFTPTSSGSYTAYLKVTDAASTSNVVTSNTVPVTANEPPSVSILPISATLDVGQSQPFSSIVSGGTSPYSYQWYLYLPTFGSEVPFPIPGATGSTWTYTPSSWGSYKFFVQVTDNAGFILNSNNATITVNPVPSVAISPSSFVMDVNQSQLFTSSVTNGTPPYTYQWYLNGAPVSGATSSTWTFTPVSSGSYSVYLNVTDNVGIEVKSNVASVTVNRIPSVSILPSSVVMNVTESQQFTSSVSDGTSPFYYQWYLNGSIVSGATGATWTFVPSVVGSYMVYVKITDNVGVQATSNISNVTVNSSGELLIHDITVTNVKTSKDGCKPMPTVGNDSFVKVNVAVLNEGNFTETFNVTLYANSTVVGTQTVSGLAAGAQTVLTYTWNVSGWTQGNYTISAYAVPVFGETNTADNNCSDGVIKIVISGDINGDGIVDIYDAIILANAYNSKPGGKYWNPNADINGNNIVDIYDAIIMANHYNQHYP